MRIVRNKPFRTQIERTRRHPMGLPPKRGRASLRELDSSHKGFESRFASATSFSYGEVIKKKREPASKGWDNPQSRCFISAGYKRSLLASLEVLSPERFWGTSMLFAPCKAWFLSDVAVNQIPSNRQQSIGHA